MNLYQPTQVHPFEDTQRRLIEPVLLPSFEDSPTRLNQHEMMRPFEYKQGKGGSRRGGPPAGGVQAEQREPLRPSRAKETYGPFAHAYAAGPGRAQDGQTNTDSGQDTTSPRSPNLDDPSDNSRAREGQGGGIKTGGQGGGCLKRGTPGREGGKGEGGRGPEPRATRSNPRDKAGGELEKTMPVRPAGIAEPGTRQREGVFHVL